jgi:hypothetical protein
MRPGKDIVKFDKDDLIIGVTKFIDQIYEPVNKLPYIFENERVSSTDVAWSLLNDDMDANYCDYYIYGIFYYTEFLGMEIEPQSHDVGLDLFTSKIDDFVNGDY